MGDPLNYFFINPLLIDAIHLAAQLFQAALLIVLIAGFRFFQACW